MKVSVKFLKNAEKTLNSEDGDAEDNDTAEHKESDADAAATEDNKIKGKTVDRNQKIEI